MRFRYPDWLPVAMLLSFLVALAFLLIAKAVEWVGGWLR